jgi:hypothetical protein
MRILVVATALLVYGGSAPHANPVGEPLPGRSMPWVPASGDTSFSRLWSSDVETLMLVLRGDNWAAGEVAIRALARRGSPEALGVLRAALTDSSFSLLQRVQIARGIGMTGDEMALPALERVSNEAYGAGVEYGGVVDLAIRLVKRPELRRPLIEPGESGLDFHFQPDEIHSIYQLRSSLMLTSGGLITRYGRGRPQLRRDVDPAEYAKVCGLLQRGTLSDLPSTYADGDYLVFELADGRHIALQRSGFAIFLADPWSFETRPFSVESDSLAFLLSHAW